MSSLVAFQDLLHQMFIWVEELEVVSLNEMHNFLYFKNFGKIPFDNL